MTKDWIRANRHDGLDITVNKIPRHTGQNPITEGDLEWILPKLL